MRLEILGTRGIPASHGGFETFAQQLALYLVGKGWDVAVYCQEEGPGPVRSEIWKGVTRIVVPVNASGAAGTILFDWKSITQAVTRQGPKVLLTLGYNTAIFCARLRLNGLPNLINMDGMEWKREKWSLCQKSWLYLNERMAGFLGDQLVADHPEIKDYLSARFPRARISMIPYGGKELTSADQGPLSEYGLTPNGFVTIIARVEPENSILEIVQGFSRTRRWMPLIVLGDYDPTVSRYRRRVMEAASAEVVFLGAIYDVEVLHALRVHTRLHIHGHRVGGTNPSLVEALGAGSAILAHDNQFNRWVAGDGAIFFNNTISCGDQLDLVLDDDAKLQRMRGWSRKRFRESFNWESILSQYEKLLERWHQ